ncbi:IclR family transcriptional regulator [Cupriavidus sp. L7L]|uniref:IclR family transcriptional regulator n=1 Tax=Cupriavidus sp. L7L TaxID=2546443 RepID=UPI00105629EB|nr:IclR family transcriptional regulator [Cupriavidus sp. L7L]TDF67189.1 IclR family transcriptional regulator [Cupriavidus sp. L7L]
MSPSSPVTMTLERGLQVLRAFRAERVPLTNGELVRRTGLSKSTVSRLTMTLVSMGFLRRVAGGPQFELASGPLDIGHAYLETSAVTRLAHPFMQQLADRLNVSVALAVPDQLDMLYVAYRTSTRIATLRLGVGSLLPMGLTAIGRAWLWGLPEDTRAGYVASVVEAAGPQAEEVQKNIEAAFEDLRTSGVCMSLGEYQRNAYGIALPLRVGRADTLMALNCGAVELRPDVDAIRARIVPELRAAAVELMVLLRDVGSEA